MNPRPVWLVLAALAALAVPSSSQAKLPKEEDPWLLLSKITRKRTYNVETRDGECARGTIKGITPDRLTAKVYSPGSIYPVTRTFNRNDVVHVGVGWAAMQPYYSGRSSWADVAALHATVRERLRIVAKSGETYDVKRPYTVSEDSIATTASGKQASVPKKDIARIYAIVEKPVSDMQAYDLDELGPFIIFDPYFYEYGFHLERYIPVLLYDADLPEDNSPAACYRDLQRLQRK